ncbi:MAG: type II toxin-antitoxin system RelE/ParE family toxin [Salinisphaera sp.]|nr:type II toxin-antitoxin system RelE/ParE family toxin [Salinisphaera sp.]
MVEILQSRTFAKWLGGLRDRRARARVNARLRRLSLGHAGDSKQVEGGIRELRIHYGPGYRVYYMQQGSVVVVLLCGGDKSSQQADIRRARTLAAQWKDGTT